MPVDVSISSTETQSGIATALDKAATAPGNGDVGWPKILSTSWRDWTKELMKAAGACNSALLMFRPPNELGSEAFFQDQSGTSQVRKRLSHQGVKSCCRLLDSWWWASPEGKIEFWQGQTGAEEGGLHLRILKVMKHGHRTPDLPHPLQGGGFAEIWRTYGDTQQAEPRPGDWNFWGEGVARGISISGQEEEWFGFVQPQPPGRAIILHNLQRSV